MTIRVILPKEIDVVVTSFGGVGTTFLLKHLGKFLHTNDLIDRDGLKHIPFPPIPRNKSVKFVYVFGDPRLAVVSLFRRNYQHVQSRKLQKFRMLQKTSPIPQKMPLAAYLLLGKDKFYFQTHFNSWYYENLSTQPTLFIRYETLFENVRYLQSFLNLPESFVTSFPQKIERVASIESLDENVRQGLDELYGIFALELRELPDVEIRQKTGTFHRFSPYWQALYALALFRYEMPYRLKRYAPGIYYFLGEILKGRL